MPADAARIKRLQRLARIRGIARESAAADVAAAETELAKARLLAQRTGKLAQDYVQPAPLLCGADLTIRARFAERMLALQDATSADAAAAQARADDRQTALVAAEKSRAAVADRAELAQALRRRKLAARALERLPAGLGTLLDK